MDYNYAIDWDVHVRLYENPDGTAWYRMLRNPPKSKNFWTEEQDFTAALFEATGSGLLHDLNTVLFIGHNPGAKSQRGVPGISQAIVLSDTIADIWREPTDGDVAFARWALSNIETGGTLDDLLVASKDEKPAPGTPLFELFAYRLLGINPLIGTEEDFIAWSSAALAIE